jgi:hypothetical protein
MKPNRPEMQNPRSPALTDVFLRKGFVVKYLGSKRFIVGLIAAATLVFATRSVRADDPSGVPTFTIRVVQVTDNPSPPDAKIAASKYWLGIQCEPIGEAVRNQLELPKDQGLLVVRVMPGGPADKAEIRPNDLLLTAGDKKLAAVADLISTVEMAKDEPLKLKLLRGGKPIEVSVRPALRPENPQANPMPPEGDRETVEQWLKQFGMNAPSALGNGITFVHPGAGLMLPPGVNIRPELPDDMSVDIHREGKKPAEITVKKGKETWRATEDDLSKLPDDVRHEVEPLLHDGPVRLWFREMKSSTPPQGASGEAQQRSP